MQLGSDWQKVVPGWRLTTLRLEMPSGTKVPQQGIIELITYGRCYASAVELSVQLLQGKWKASILHCLGTHPSLRYGDIRRALPGLADKVLTQRLRDLEDAELVERVVAARGHVAYSLTPLGRSLTPIMQSLEAWGVKRGGSMRARFVAPEFPIVSPSRNEAPRANAA
jgi:DNA-binding HxlR family transcriptional regulator